MTLPPGPLTLDARGRAIVLAAGFGTWMLSGIQMGLTPLLARPAIRDMLFAGSSDLSPEQEAAVAHQFAALMCALLLGAAFGGLLFGWAGDRFGRVRALAASVACFSLFTASQAFTRTPGELLALRFLASLGIGGTWPNAVALVSEAWPGASRPALAGVMGTAANVGILIVGVTGGLLGLGVKVWRLTSLASGVPFLLAPLLLLVPESPRWAARQMAPPAPSESLFRTPLLGRTIIGIIVGAIPLVGTWSAGKWLIPWAGATMRDSRAAAVAQAVGAAGAVFGSLAGGWIAAAAGRRSTYFAVSLLTLAVNFSLYMFLTPLSPMFLPAAFVLGLVSTVFYGWLPLYLPELFPTRSRATGAGVTFNFGRFIAAPMVLVAAACIDPSATDVYPRIGAIMAWVYALGMVAILFAPDTSKGMSE